ncbi:MAG: hypothetical protein IPJ88_03185 [Myxococcales bacterium]|nr:MAG: hypothetical protein IPJ88_03185 [Myxococcales bacterium]
MGSSKLTCCAWLCLVSTLAFCGSSPREIELNDEESTQLQQLFYSEDLEAPPDISNAYADDADAALLGQRFFFDPIFSGRLLDADNDGIDSDGDGQSDSLGLVGETGKVSCAGCHLPEAGFSDSRSRGKQISLASSWVLRRTPSLLEVGHRKLMMWDGRRDSLHSQVFSVIESPREMNSSRLFVAKQIWEHYKPDYEAVFGPLPPLDDTDRFAALDAEQTGCDFSVGEFINCHGMPGDGAEFDGMSEADQTAVTEVVINFGKAISAYERKLRCGPSLFDAWLSGDNSALSLSAQRGAKIFVGTGKCVECHSGPLLSDNAFHNVGLEPRRVAVAFVDADDRGAIVGLETLLSDPLNTLGQFSDGYDERLPSALESSMEGAFLTPPLRCVSLRPSFMHTGHITELEDVVSFFSRGGDPAGYPGDSEIGYLGLDTQEQQDLLAFLKALDGAGPSSSLLSQP